MFLNAPERANIRLKREDFGPEKADFGPERTELGPERTNFRAEKAGFSPRGELGEGGGDELTNLRDGQTNKSLPVFYRTSSPFGPLPKEQRMRVFGTLIST